MWLHSNFFPYRLDLQLWLPKIKTKIIRGLMQLLWHGFSLLLPLKNAMPPKHLITIDSTCSLANIIVLTTLGQFYLLFHINFSRVSSVDPCGSFTEVTISVKKRHLSQNNKVLKHTTCNNISSRKYSSSILRWIRFETKV